MRLELQPMTKDNIGMSSLIIERVVVILPHRANRHKLGERKIENDPSVILTKVIGLLILGKIGGLGSPYFLLLRQLLFRAEQVATLGAPMRMTVKYS